MGCSTVGRASDRHAADAGSIPRCARDFSPRVNFQCRLFSGVRTSPCAIACIYLCAHVKDPVAHVRVWWIMETLKHPACNVGWVRDSIAAGFPQGRQPEFPMEEIPFGQYSYKKLKKKKKVVIFSRRMLEPEQTRRMAIAATWIGLPLRTRRHAVQDFVPLRNNWNPS